MFRSLYRLRAFNGDPHPGNYLFQPDGRVTFLDFGLVKHFTEPEIDMFGDMIQAMVIEGDTARYRSIIEQIGLLQAGHPVSDQQVHEYFSHFYEFVMHDEVVTITPQWSTDAVSRFFDPSGPVRPGHQGRQPAGQLRDHPAHQPRAHGDPRRPARHRQLPRHRRGAVALGRRAAVDPPMGEAEAAWLASRSR